MAYTGRGTLIEAASSNGGDIATACYLLMKIAPESPSPGELITWICRMQPELMLDQANRFGDLTAELEQIDSTHVRRLYQDPDRGWDGPAGRAFEDRWVNDLLTYVGKDGSSGRRADFAETERMLRSVAHVTDRLQERVANYINVHIEGLHWKFIEACRSDGETEYETDSETVVTSVIAGAALAVSTSNPIGWAVGGLGIVVNAVFDFMENSVREARDSVGAAVAGSAMSVQGVREELTDFQVIEETRYRPAEDLPYDEYEGPGAY